MPAGVIIYNDFGTVLIDDSNSNMMFVGRGTSTVIFTSPQGQNTWRWNMGGGYVYDAAQVPQVIFRSDAYVSGVKPRVDSSVSPKVVRGRTEADAFTTGATVYWAVIDKPVIPGGETFGLQVSNAAGQVMFDSRLKHPTVYAVLTPTVVGTEYTQALVPGREYMFMTGSYAFCKIVSNTAYVKATSAAYLNIPVLILDITGF
jgi:hypothetical protein